MPLQGNKTRVFFAFYGKRAQLHREALKVARSAYFSTLEEENKTLAIYLKQWLN